MTVLLPRAIIFILLVIGLLLLTSPLRAQSGKTPFGKKKPKKFLDKLIYPLVRRISPLINLTSYKRLKLLNDLERAGVFQTPEEYYATAIVKALGYVVLSAFAYLLGMALPTIALLIASVLEYVKGIQSVDTLLKKKDEEILYALPNFTAVISETYKRNKNIAKIFETYLRDVPDTPLYIDLSRTIARMNANGNVPEALALLDKAVGNLQFSRFLSALSEAYKGADQSMAFALCADRMEDLRTDNIRRKAAQRPRKMQLVGFAVAAAIVALFMMPLLLQLLTINTLL